MDPTIVMMGVQAAVRLGRAGHTAFEQHARDRDVLLPMVNAVKISPRAEMMVFLEVNSDDISEDLRGYWDSFRGRGPHLAGDIDMMASEYFRIVSLKNHGAQAFADEAAGYWMVSQWGKDGPVGPLGRIVVTMADVALEFAAHDPTLFGISGRAEPVIKALALHLADLVPDDTDDLGAKNLLGERLAGIFLRASLKAMSDHPEALIEEQHLQMLVKNTLPKLLEQLPDGLDLPPKRDVIEALLGPVANAALATLADRPVAFFGSHFDADEPLGALTRTFLLKAADIGLGQTFTKAGAVELYRSALRLAAARPELFLGAPGDAADKLVTALFQGLAGTLEQHSPPFDHATVTELLVTTVDAIGASSGLVLDANKPWDHVFGQVLSQVLGALGESLRTGDRGALMRLKSGDGLRKFVRIVLDQAAKTPGMMVEGSEDVQRIVAAVAGAMAKDEYLLLSGDDWLIILAVAAEEVAANPARLFGLKSDAAATDIATPLIESLLLVASTQWKDLGRSGGTVLFGPTLREAIVVTLRTASGNAKAAFDNRVMLRQLVEVLNGIVAANPGYYGSKEWLRVYRVLILRVLQDGALGTIDAAYFDSILKGGN